MLDNLKLDEIILPNETKHQIYLDGFQPTIRETGKIIGRIPRAINAAFSGLDCWIEEREFHVARTKELLSHNLKDVDPEKIVSPEPYVAVPAITALSYSMNSEELRKMYANLLAKSIYNDTKSMVHPAFTEIIKNLSPLDCRVFEFIMKKGEIGCYEMRVGIIGETSYHVSQPYITEMDFEQSDVIASSIDNLLRNKLIIHENFIYENDAFYACVRETVLYKAIETYYSVHPNNEELRPKKMAIKSTSLGRRFYEVCCLPI